MASNKSKSLVHSVFFTLKDRSPAARDALIEACRHCLADHPGSEYFAVGARAEGYQRPVNDTEFDVAVLIAFASEADHDRYQNSERHQRFISENQSSWAKVRVFDSWACPQSVSGG